MWFLPCPPGWKGNFKDVIHRSVRSWAGSLYRNFLQVRFLDFYHHHEFFDTKVDEHLSMRAPDAAIAWHTLSELWPHREKGDRQSFFKTTLGLFSLNSQIVCWIFLSSFSSALLILEGFFSLSHHRKGFCNCCSS